VPLLASSAGLTEYQRSDAGIDALLLRADQALYEAKRGGRNCCVRRAPAREAEAVA